MQKKNIDYFIGLMNRFLSGQMRAREFCDEFYMAYDLEVLETDITDGELFILKNLSPYIDRYSEFKSDHKKFPGIYYTADELRNKVQEAMHQIRGFKE